MADALSPYEIASSGQEYGEDLRFVGIRLCRVLEGQIAGLRQHFDPSMGAVGYWPGAGGLFGARVWKYALAKYDAARWDLKVWYRQPTPSQLVSPTKAMLYVKVVGRATRLLRETAGEKRVIEGPVIVNGNLVENRYWKLYTGDNIGYIGDTAELTLLTAFANPKVNLFLDYLDCINNSDLPNFGGAKKGTVKFIGTSFGGRMAGQQYWGGWQHFQYKKYGWTCWVDQEKKVIETIGADDDPGLERTIMQSRWVDPTHAGKIERDIHSGTADFSAFNALLNWM